MRILHLGFFSFLILSQLEYLTAKTRTICNTNRIVCQKERIIRVTEATFGRFGKRKKRKKKISCGTKNNVLSEVKELCDENTSCLLDTSSPVFIKPCPGSSVCLRVTWKCQKKKGCPRENFKCTKRSKKCLPNSKKCDGKRDCRNGSDERKCGCNSNQFQCAASKKCISKFLRCNQIPDCPDESDEKNCECQTGEFRCKTSTICIPESQKCNGKNDCKDGSDEISCGCRSNEFQCATSKRCISDTLKCNQQQNCDDGSDENNCGCDSNELQCKTSRKCIPATLECNRKLDCQDGSDEQNCNCEVDEFRCTTSTLCIPSSKKCNGKKDCKDGSDEINCGCKSNEFECETSRTCISNTLQCNQNEDCADGSDEKNCPEVQCGVPNVVAQLSNCRRLRIVGGCRAQPHSWPWAVQLLLRYDKNSNFTHECGGAILNSRFVITASHCFLSESDIRNWQIKAGSHYKDRSESSDQIRLIKKKSPLFNPTTNILDRDITILEVDTPFVVNTYVRPVCLPERHPRKGDNCAVVGWGSTQGTGNADILKQTPMPIEDTHTCNNTSNLKGDITDYMFCGGFKEGLNDACQGDSGGPLMCLEGGKYRLQGIVSWGIDCAKPNLPGVYADVFKVLQWIKVVTGM